MGQGLAVSEEAAVVDAAGVSVSSVTLPMWDVSPSPPHEVLLLSAIRRQWG